MLNLAGREYDFGPVLYTILQECEHRRHSLPEGDEQAAARLIEIARQKLAEIAVCYTEAGGSPGYWHELETEVIETALPQYARAAAAQTRLEEAAYGLWRQGDPLSRVLLGLAGLTVGGLIVKAPFIPIVEDAFAFVLAGAAFLYPEIRRWYCNWRYSRLLNQLIVQAEAYQHRQLPYVSEAGLAAELDAVGREPRATAGHQAVPTLPPTPAAKGAAAGQAEQEAPGGLPGPRASARRPAVTGGGRPHSGGPR